MLLLELIYRIIVFVRNKAYNYKLVKPYKTKAFVISIGNITAGGSGKTPLLIKTANLLKDKGFKVAIVTGGYKRKGKGFTLIHNVDKLLTNVENAGDESILIAEKVKVPLAVDDKKWKAAKKLDQKFEPDIIIVDDGFQHRKLHRDLDIVIIDKNTVKQKHIMPKGYLRESKSSINRADILIYRDLNDKIIQSLDSEYHKVSFNIISNASLVKNTNSKTGIISAIANPEKLKDQLKKQGMKIDVEFIYKDHYTYSSKDIDNIITKCRSEGINRLITTEKDEVKLRTFNSDFENNDIGLEVVKLEFIFNEKEKFIDHIERQINEKIN